MALRTKTIHTACAILVASRVLMISCGARVGATKDVEAGYAVVPPDGGEVAITGIVDAP